MAVRKARVSWKAGIGDRDAFSAGSEGAVIWLDLILGPFAAQSLSCSWNHRRKFMVSIASALGIAGAMSSIRARALQ